MPRIQITVGNELLRQASRLSLSGVQNALQKKTIAAAKKVMQDAAKVFVTHLAKNVPVLTGESLGSVLPVARAIRAATAVNRALTRAGKKPAARGRNFKSRGEAQGFGGLEFANGKWTFEFGTDVAHFIFRENNVVVTDVRPQRQTPWHVIKAADKLMRKNISRNLNKHMRAALKEVFPQLPIPGPTRISSAGTDILS